MGKAPANSSGTSSVKGEPLFRWAGGKRRLLGQILPQLPKTYNHFYEPFCGGAALFFKLRPKNATLGDKNGELINCYRQVKNHVEDVIFGLQQLRNSKKDYYEIRGYVPEDRLSRAVRFIYLMELSFNGIYRVNKSGEFNVPYGSKTKKCFDMEKIREVSKAFAGVEIVDKDFEETVENAKQGDLVYFDPPYTVAHGNNGFVQYNEKILSWDDQIRLADLSLRLVNRGCHVFISNADHKSLEKLYLEREFKIQRVSRHSAIGATIESRKHITEFVFTK